MTAVASRGCGLLKKRPYRGYSSLVRQRGHMIRALHGDQGRLRDQVRQPFCLYKGNLADSSRSRWRAFQVWYRRLT